MYSIKFLLMTIVTFIIGLVKLSVKPKMSSYFMYTKTHNSLKRKIIIIIVNAIIT